MFAVRVATNWAHIRVQPSYTIHQFWVHKHSTVVNVSYATSTRNWLWNWYNLKSFTAHVRRSLTCENRPVVCQECCPDSKLAVGAVREFPGLEGIPNQLFHSWQMLIQPVNKLTSHLLISHVSVLCVQCFCGSTDSSVTVFPDPASNPLFPVLPPPWRSVFDVCDAVMLQGYVISSQSRLSNLSLSHTERQWEWGIKVNAL